MPEFFNVLLSCILHRHEKFFAAVKEELRLMFKNEVLEKIF